MHNVVDHYKEKLLEIIAMLNGSFSKEKSTLDLLNHYTDITDSLLIILLIVLLMLFSLAVWLSRALITTLLSYSSSLYASL